MSERLARLVRMRPSLELAACGAVAAIAAEATTKFSEESRRYGAREPLRDIVGPAPASKRARKTIRESAINLAERNEFELSVPILQQTVRDDRLRQRSTSRSPIRLIEQPTQPSRIFDEEGTDISAHNVDPTHVFTLSQVYEGLLLKIGEKGVLSCATPARTLNPSRSGSRNGSVFERGAVGALEGRRFSIPTHVCSRPPPRRESVAKGPAPTFEAQHTLVKFARLTKVKCGKDPH
jgi:hypothetical protein